MTSPPTAFATSPGFSMASSAWLRERGIKGMATVSLAPEGLHITGEEGGVLRILSPQIRRVRTNWVSVKYGPFFLTRVWLEGEAKPLKLEWRGLPADAYAALVRGLAAQLARVDGMRRLQRGSSIATALELAVPLVLLFVAALAISVIVLDGDEWWERMMPSLAALPFAVLGIGLATIRWPRQVRDLEEFNRRVA